MTSPPSPPLPREPALQSTARIRSLAPTLRKWNVIDRLREQIQERLDQLAHEADRLRKALAVLDPRSSTAPTRKPPARKPPAASKPDSAPATKPTARAAKTATARRTPKPAARSSRRTAPGATKTSVLAALAGGEAMTAGQVADKTGLARPTVSTTLSKLAKTGEVEKAERGYRLASAPAQTPSSPDA
jgi:DNA-binding transcriptional ArsR family regulator